MSLGPVTITKAWEPKRGAKTDSVFYIVKDESGEAGLTIWGPSAHSGARVGDQITITGQSPSGGLSKNEFNNKVGIAANSCKVVISGQSEEQPTSTRPPTTTGVQLSKDEMIMLHAEIKNNMKQILVGYGWTNEGAEKAASTSVQDMALWWFGEKTVR